MTKYSNFKDYEHRKILRIEEGSTFIILKSLVLRKETSNKIRFKIMLLLSNLFHTSLGKKFYNRCIFSTKVRSVNRITNLTKASFNENLK